MSVSSSQHHSPPPRLPLRIRILNFGYSAGLTSVRWDETVEELRLSRTKYRFGWTLVEALFVLMYQIFLIYQSTIKVLDMEIPKGNKIRLRYNAGLWIFMVCNHIGDIWTGEYVVLMNGLESFKRQCGGT